MEAPSVKYNTYFQSGPTPYIDNISKFYLIFELMFGINRIPVFGNLRFIFQLIGTIYSPLIVTLYVVWVFLELKTKFDLLVIAKLMKFMVCTLFSLITWKRLQLYYCELNKFDMNVGSRPCVTKGSIKNIVLLIVVLLLLLIVFLLPYKIPQLSKPLTALVLVHMYDAIEIHFFGHLLKLLTPRLRLINYFMESSLTNLKDTTGPNPDEFIFFKRDVTNSNCEMKKLMDLYHTIIKSYDFLIEAIKWQLFLIIIDSFLSALGLIYYYTYSVIRNSNLVHNYITDIGLSLVIILPLFSPCIFGDQIHNEVRRFRELLASRLYENKLDKSSRSIARALLEFTETRDLSFSLLRMLSIDISLPFKFVGLIVTYLIILLQFEKVINP